MYITKVEQRELLEEEAMFYLQALLNSEPIGRDENPNVYIKQGILNGMCLVFGAYFEVELRRKITFYKGIYPGEGKFWFEVINEDISEEGAREMIDYLRNEQRKLRETMKMI